MKSKIRDQLTQEIIDMGVTVVTHNDSGIKTLWINNVFISQGKDLYINSKIADQAEYINY